MSWRPQVVSRVRGVGQLPSRTGHPSHASEQSPLRPQTLTHNTQTHGRRPSCARLTPQAEFRADRRESGKLRDQPRASMFLAQERSPFSRQNVLNVRTKIRKERITTGSGESGNDLGNVSMTKARRAAEGSQPESHRSPRSLAWNGTSTAAKSMKLAVSCSTLDLTLSDPCGLCSTFRVGCERYEEGRLLRMPQSTR
jgi:hypothetical protein